MLLETGDHVIVMGRAGTGKSESIKLLLNDYPSRVLVSTPTGMLSAAFCGNTY
jgi:predicted AAA+ superfamily ATPase